ncbi:APC family permease [Halomonas litopenaei]|uniref:APC family permease n=1 Tax=Halomonas litopenaei TaxID=2109328 RepID=UPI001A8DF778|nr:APC family permease [Halomonas litopenaei]MBN8412707.1 APC family permease [Halomonas litopenaei]
MSEPSVQLTARLSLASVVAFGIAYMAPSLVMVIFGVVAEVSEGAAPTAFLLATGGMLLTALSYAKMSGHFPVSGSAYFYARQMLGAPAGFMIGWSVLLAYLLLPAAAWLVQSLLLNAQFPSIPLWAWMLVNAGLTTLINVIGIRLTDRVNKLLVLLAVFMVLLFAAYCLAYLGSRPPASYTAPFWNTDSTLIGVSAAAAIAAYSYLGFDAVTTLAEETRDAKRNIPRAVVLVIATGGLMFTAVAYLMQLVHPGGFFDDPEVISYTMSIQVGGLAFADWTNLAANIGGLGSCLAVQLSSSRLLYFMGRDGVLPKRLLGTLHPRTRTPVGCLLLTGAMGFIGLNLSVETALSLVNFGIFVGFTAVNLSVIAYFIRHHHERPLGILGYILFPALAGAITLTLIAQLSPSTLTVGLFWLAAGGLHLLWLTRGFRRPTPELSLDDGQPV